MYLSPLTWGTNDMLTDSQQTSHDVSNHKYRSNFKAMRIERAKKRKDDPKFVTVLRKITALHPPAPYFPNPLAENRSNTRLGEYVNANFLWDKFPRDIDIGETSYSFEIERNTLNLTHILFFQGLVSMAKVASYPVQGSLERDNNWRILWPL